MNCKPGDLAVVVSAGVTPEMIGRIVIVDRLVSDGEAIGNITVVATHHAVWLCRPISGMKIPLRTLGGRLLFVPSRPISDVHLRPIRDQKGKDETLTWAPKKVTA